MSSARRAGTPLPPLAHPNILGGGANYRTHGAEMMTYNKARQHLREPGESDEAFYARNLAAVDERARSGIPFFWSGMHSSLSGAQAEIPLPVVGEHNDWELELGVIVKKAEFRRSDVYWGHDWVSKHLAAPASRAGPAEPWRCGAQDEHSMAMVRPPVASTAQGRRSATT